MYVLPHHLYDRHTWKGDDIERGDPTHQITWPWDYLVRRQIKNLVSALSQQIWPPNLAGWWPTVRGARTPGYVIFLQCGHMKNEKELHPHFRIIYGPQTWHDGYFGWGNLPSSHLNFWPLGDGSVRQAILSISFVVS